ncbi:MAG: sigma-70 family RNA polymerase sigma factor, partial [Gemmatimonadetes bacterium]|nr:sigma-70 family RNA polymerase sigma factor [Gemmatimonadota bacterium]
MHALRIDGALLTRLYRLAKAERWQLPVEHFAAALQASAGHVLGGRSAGARELERALASLHLEDLAIGCACEAGSEAAWEHFVREQRPALYRAADALDPSGGARELADSLYAELYGLREREGERQSLFRYFHGRSSLATWLRAVLSQRYVDRVRAARRLQPLPDEETAAGPARGAEPPDPSRAR